MLRSIVNTAIDGIITIDTTGTIQTFNNAAEIFFGSHTADESHGTRTFRCSCPKPYQSQHDRYIGNYLETVSPRSSESPRSRGPTQERSTLPDRPGHLGIRVRRRASGFTGLVRDISARKESSASIGIRKRWKLLASWLAESRTTSIICLPYSWLQPDTAVRA